jgi:hypothetical protein
VPGDDYHRGRRRRTPERLHGVHAVNLLLDTHALLWSTMNDPQLSKLAARLIVDPANNVFMSPASSPKHWSKE